MQKFTLKAEPRTELGKQNIKLRNSRMVPAVVYGHGSENINVSVLDSDFRKVFSEAEQSGLIELAIGDTKEPAIVLVQDLQRDPLTQDVQHVDFYRVKMGEKLTATVSIEFIGEAPAEKELGGNVVTARDSVEIECLPKDLVQHLQVDLSQLKEFGDAIHFSDLQIPAGVELVGEPETVIVSVQEPKKVEEEATVEAVHVNAVEVEKKGKQDEEENSDSDKGKDEEKK